MNRAGKISAVTRIGRLWDVILVTDDGFGARMCRGVGGGGDTIGGGGVGEPRTGIIYICMYVCLYVCSLYIDRMCVCVRLCVWDNTETSYTRS